MNVNDLNPVDGVHCPHCLNCFRVVGLDASVDGELNSEYEYEFEPSYCPACGMMLEKQKGRTGNER